MATGYNNYNAIPQSEYIQPPGYSERDVNQQLHRPVNNSFGTQPEPYYPTSDYPPPPPSTRQQPPYDPYQGNYIPKQPQYNPHYVASPYAPAPPVLQQQSTTNVVVVNQPSASGHVIHVAPPQAKTYLALTGVMIVLCTFHGNLPALLCLIPALICAYVASGHNNAGEYEEARKCGQLAFCCNVLSFTYYALAFVGGVVVLAMYFSVGFSGESD